MAITTTAPSRPTLGTPSGAQPNYNFALGTLTLLFFMMGFITCLNDILIPYLKLMFSLNYTQVMLINTCFFGAYFFMSIPSGKIVESIGYKKGMVGGFLAAAVGCLMFYPAAEMKSYNMFLLALFILASGITLLQVAGNPYVAVLGRPETSSARLTLTQAFNSLGTTIAPLLGTYLILSNLPEITEGIDAATIDASVVQNSYLGIAAVLVIIAIIMSLVKLPNIKAGDLDQDSIGGASRSAYASAWQARHLVLGAVAIFMYVGAEVAIGSFLVNYLGSESVMGMAEKEAGNYVAYYWGGAMIGRFIGAYALRVLNPGKLLVGFCVATIILVLISMFTTGELAMWSILAVGLFNSIMFATIFTLAVMNLYEHTNQGSGILCTAIVGGAIIPLIQGYIADQSGLTTAFIIPILCYLYIAWYGFSGHKVTKATAVRA
jgi:FHS family L-fucose permease-like MFS transporter